MTFFHQLPIYMFKPKVGTRMSQCYKVWMFENLDTWKIVHFVHLGVKVSGNVWNFVAFLNIWILQHLYHLCVVEGNHDP